MIKFKTDSYDALEVNVMPDDIVCITKTESGVPKVYLTSSLQFRCLDISYEKLVQMWSDAVDIGPNIEDFFGPEDDNDIY